MKNPTIVSGLNGIIFLSIHKNKARGRALNTTNIVSVANELSSTPVSLEDTQKAVQMLTLWEVINYEDKTITINSQEKVVYVENAKLLNQAHFPYFRHLNLVQ